MTSAIIGKDLNLIDKGQFNFIWVTDWPLFEYDEELGRYFAAHHPFTSPKAEDIDKLESAPHEVKANAYDIVLNGYELGGGSIRINDAELQERMFRVLRFSQMKNATASSGFLIGALNMVPRRTAVHLLRTRPFCDALNRIDNIRNVIAFLKHKMQAT